MMDQEEKNENRRFLHTGGVSREGEKERGYERLRDDKRKTEYDTRKGKERKRVGASGKVKKKSISKGFSSFSSSFSYKGIMFINRTNSLKFYS